MKIIVLAGGLSTERDVSLSSSAGICRTLLEKGHDAFLLDVFMGFPYEKDRLEEVFTLPDHGLDIVKNISEEEPDLAAVKASRPDQSDCFLGPNVIELCRMADITFLGLHGGEGRTESCRRRLICSESVTQDRIPSAVRLQWIKG
nr:D_ala_D_alaTIGR: D-alanine--D-alanine [uncultured bacterium]